MIKFIHLILFKFDTQSQPINLLDEENRRPAISGKSPKFPQLGSCLNEPLDNASIFAEAKPAPIIIFQADWA